jgi:N-acetyl-1-D-myo-inositol-2-amino-2-deoxy-alpha-D-glucopyranoside deacetylase
VGRPGPGIGLSTTGETVVAVVAHPDDESLIAGGTLALAAERGVRTGVVTLTRGENGPVAPASLPGGESLGAARERELHEAAGMLGVEWVACLRRPDGELEWGDHEEIAGELAEILAEHGATAVLTFGEEGLYWHPDHIAARSIAGLAVDRLEARSEGRVWVYEAVWPNGMPAELTAAVRERGLPADLWGIEPEAFGPSAQDATIVVDVREVLHRKLAALRAHRTQLGPDHLLTALPDDLARRFLGTELWRISRPRDGGEGPLGGWR